ncbi:hypothetical protein [Nocardia sp. MW-W600-9]
MTSDRDTLAELITQELDFHYSIDSDNCEPIEAGIKAGCTAAIAKGWRPPAREITDPAVREEFRHGSIAIDRDGEVWISIGTCTGPRWRCRGAGSSHTTSEVVGDFGPLTIVYVPTEEADCPHDSRSGTTDGRWRCDECGADCGPNTYHTEDGAE